MYQFECYEEEVGASSDFARMVAALSPSPGPGRCELFSVFPWTVGISEQSRKVGSVGITQMKEI